MKSYELNLSRWHKVNERLQGEMGRLSKAIATEINRELSLTAHATTDSSVVEEMRADVEKMTKLHSNLVASWVMIRGMLALKNAEVGVSARLAQVEGLNFQIGVLRLKHAAESSKMHGFQDYKAMQPVSGTPDMLGRPRGAVTSVAVRLYEKRELDEMLEEIQRMSRQIVRIQDENATINAKNVMALELSDEVATVAAII